MGGGANDPLNQGWMIVGGGEESDDLYTGTFQTVKVLSDDWYSTNLKEIIVGNADPIAARLQGPQGMPTNSIVDSGTNSLNLSAQLLQAVISKFLVQCNRRYSHSRCSMASWFRYQILS